MTDHRINLFRLGSAIQHHAEMLKETIAKMEEAPSENGCKWKVEDIFHADGSQWRVKKIKIEHIPANRSIDGEESFYWTAYCKYLNEKGSVTAYWSLFKQRIEL